VDWLERTGGHLALCERVLLLLGGLPGIAEGIRLGGLALHDERRMVGMDRFEPPDTPMVRAAREYLAAHAGAAMANHSYRTSFWGLVVLHEQGDLTPEEIETTWVAGLLHDVGLEDPPDRGDFTMGGVHVLVRLAREHRWSDERTRQAAEAITINLHTHPDPRRSGRIGWALNVGGLGELGMPTNRAQWHPDRVAELEARFPRAGLREEAMRLIHEERSRLPDGRFALLGRFFPLIMRD